MVCHVITMKERNLIWIDTFLTRFIDSCDIWIYITITNNFILHLSNITWSTTCKKLEQGWSMRAWKSWDQKKSYNCHFNTNFYEICSWHFINLTNGSVNNNSWFHVITVYIQWQLILDPIYGWWCNNIFLTGLIGQCSIWVWV